MNKWKEESGKLIFLFPLLFFCLACTGGDRAVTVTVTNPVDVERADEMVEVSMTEVSDLLRLDDTAQIVVLNAEGEQVPYQVTYDDRLIFPATVSAGGKTAYTIAIGTPIDVEVKTCGRQYPERADDVAWENDLVGFRAYGPALQARGERGFGYDLFTKRGTRAPVLEEMYAGDLSHTRSYHQDHGYGMDCYAVGPTLGAGTAALMRGDTLLYPWCYRSYEILDNGPLRFTVRLTYGSDSLSSTETRLITLDAGQHLNRTAVTYNGLTATQPIAVGIVLHEPDGAVKADTEAGYIAYDDPTTGTDNGRIFVGAAFPAAVREAKCVLFPEEEKPTRNGAEGHLLAVGDYEPGSDYVYYWGFGWSRADIPTFDAWNRYMADFAERLHNPLQVTVVR